MLLIRSWLHKHCSKRVKMSEPAQYFFSYVLKAIKNSSFSICIRNKLDPKNFVSHSHFSLTYFFRFWCVETTKPIHSFHETRWLGGNCEKKNAAPENYLAAFTRSNEGSKKVKQKLWLQLELFWKIFVVILKECGWLSAVWALKNW